MVISTLCALPFSAFAADYDVWVGGTRVTSTNADNILGNGTAAYDAANKILTLTGANIQTGYDSPGGKAGIYTTQDLTIVGSGNIGNGDIEFGICAQEKNTMIINGDFTVTGSSNGICSYDGGKLYFEGGSINTTGGINGVFVSKGDATVNGGSVIATGNGASNAYGYGVQGNTLTVNGGSIKAVGGTSGNLGAGIALSDISNSFNINGGRVIAIGSVCAIENVPVRGSTVSTIASVNIDGTSAVTYNSSQNNNYKWFKAEAGYNYHAVGDCFAWGFSVSSVDSGLNDNGGGTYTRTFHAAKAVPKAMLKVTDGSSWYGDELGRNYTFTITKPGRFTVTFDSTNYMVSVTGDVVSEYVLTPDSVTAIGTGKNNFLNNAEWSFSNDNNLTQVSPGVWEITYNNVGTGTYEFKFLLDGNWASNFGTESTNVLPSGIAQDAKYNASKNIGFDIHSDNSTVKLQLDLSNYRYLTDSGAKYTVTVNGITSEVFTDITAAVSGYKDGGKVSETTATTMAKGYTVSVIDWHDCDSVFDKNGENEMSPADTFVGDKTYTVGVRFTPEGYNTIAKNVDATINGEEGLIGGYYGGTSRDFYITVYIPPHVHDFATVITPATLTKNGSVAEKCECGEIQSTKPIYYPKTIKLSKTAFTYNGKAQKPTVTVKDSKGKVIAAKNYKVTYPKGMKAIGAYKVKITFKGNYSGTKTLTYKINPKGTALDKVTSPKAKQLKATWKKQTTQTTGYQIQYSTDKSFKKDCKTATVSKNKTTSKTVGKLKSKKTYYVRVRTYKIVGKTKCYSSWSKAKYVKVK